MFLLHNDLIYHQHSPLLSFRLHDPNALAVDFKQVIISVIFFTVLFANQIMICSTSAAHVQLVLSCLLNPSAMVADFEHVIVPVICFLTCLLTRYWSASCQQQMCHQFCLLCICGVLATFELVIVSFLLYLILFVSLRLVHLGYLAM